MSKNEIFELHEPVYHEDLPGIPLMVISKSLINGKTNYILEKIGSPQVPDKLSRATKRAYLSFWNGSKPISSGAVKKLYKSNIDRHERDK